ncbi:Universal stress protein F [Salmonella enterica subsp. enterica]|uniref:Universal stress protein F n=1 Tax=Salmonella enterica I TaxID=59201 RepID=A0A3S4LXZ8_SALET|nr:Universal stress protein F [Salmonella enterica subsp. enterica]
MLKPKQRLDDAKVHFFDCNPVFALLRFPGTGLFSRASRNGRFERPKPKSQLEAIIKKFNLPADRVQAHVAEGSPKDKILEMAKKIYRPIW